MKAEELRTKSTTELKETVLKLKRELLNLRFQQVNGQLQSPAQLRNLRKDVARAKTILKELESTSSQKK